MSHDNSLLGVLLDEKNLTLEELAHACGVAPQWVIERIQTKLILQLTEGDTKTWRFDSISLRRARRLVFAEQVLDANPELAALVADLLEERDALRSRLGESD